MTIHLASDHAGFAHKEHVKAFLMQKGYEVVDYGAHELAPEDDYPDFILPCAEAVAQDAHAKGVIFGGSGQGEAIVANKVKGIRAALYYGGEESILTLSREHNDANILSLGARFIEKEAAPALVELWLSTSPDTDERHQRRIKKIHSYE